MLQKRFSDTLYTTRIRRSKSHAALAALQDFDDFAWGEKCMISTLLRYVAPISEDLEAKSQGRSCQERHDGCLLPQGHLMMLGNLTLRLADTARALQEAPTDDMWATSVLKARDSSSELELAVTVHW